MAPLTEKLLARGIVVSMIPYDDLVAALSAWRARQGLPVSTMGGAPGSGPTPSSGSGPQQAMPGSGPNRGAPPPAPPRAASPIPPPLDEALDVEEAAMLEEQYETEGSDFAMSFGQGGANEAEATAIGGAPERPTDNDDMRGGGGWGRGGNKRNDDDW
jgi:hypothetical protein